MNQTDWVGAPPHGRSKTTVIRPATSTDQEKDRLRERIRAISNRVPPAIVNGSVQEVRRWKSDIEAALSVLARKRASVPDLQLALSRLQPYASRAPE